MGGKKGIDEHSTTSVWGHFVFIWDNSKSFQIARKNVSGEFLVSQ